MTCISMHYISCTNILPEIIIHFISHFINFYHYTINKVYLYKKSSVLLQYCVSHKYSIL